VTQNIKQIMKPTYNQMNGNAMFGGYRSKKKRKKRKSKKKKNSKKKKMSKKK